MEKLLSRMLNFLKYLLFIIAFILVLYGIIVTYKRLEKSLTLALPVFLPFFFTLIVYIINLFMKKNMIRDNLLYNFTSVLVFAVIIVVCLRAGYDDYMVMYQKYDISYNPLFLSDNLSSIEMLLYVLAGSNVLIMLSGLFNDSEKSKNTFKGNKTVEIPLNDSIINKSPFNEDTL